MPNTGISDMYWIQVHVGILLLGATRSTDTTQSIDTTYCKLYQKHLLEDHISVQIQRQDMKMRTRFEKYETIKIQKPSYHYCALNIILFLLKNYLYGM